MLTRVVLLLLAVSLGGVCGVRTQAATELAGGFKTVALPAANPTLMYGHGVELARDADILAVGEAATIAMPGSVYVYEADPATGAWTSTANLTTLSTERDFFGVSMAFTGSGSTLVVGAPRTGSGTDNDATSEGAVYVFNRTAVGGYSQVQVLTLPVTGERDRLGTQVEVSADGERVFAMSMDVFCSHGSCGTSRPANRGIHVWGRGPDGSYTYEAQVQTSEPSLYFWQAGQSFSVSDDGAMLYILSYDQDYIAENLAAVDGNYTQILPTKLSVWTRNAGDGTWSEGSPLRAPTARAASQAFGARSLVDASLGDVYVAAPRNDSTVYKVSSGSGEIGQTFAEGNSAMYDVSGIGDCNVFVQPWKSDGSFFGQDMGLAPGGQLLAVGAPFGVESQLGRGAVYLYTRNVGVNDGVWNLADTFMSGYTFSYQPSGFQAYDYEPGDPGYDPVVQQGIYDQFGLDVAINDRYLAVGAMGINKVFIYDRLQDYLVVPPPPPPPPPIVSEIVTPQETSGGSIALALIIGLILLLLLLIALFFLARWGIKQYFRKKYSKDKDADGMDGDDSSSLDSGSGADAVAADAADVELDLF